MGGDLDLEINNDEEKVSIHAPAWGATKDFSDFLPIYKFQSTPPHGGRLIPAKMTYQKF